MRRTLASRFAPALLVGALIVTGCAKNSQPSAANTKPPVAQSEQAPLNIPASFASEDAKRDFAVKAVDTRYYKEGAKLLEESVAVQPNALAYEKLGIARYNLGDNQGAIQAWNKSAELDPASQAEMQNNIGNALRDAKDYKGAEAAYRKALSLDSTQKATLINLAALLKSQQRLNEAITVLDQASPNIKSDPGVASMLASLRQEVAAAPTKG